MKKRKHNHKVVISIRSKSFDAIERQYRAMCNNEMLEASLYYKQNTNQVG